MPGPRDNPSPAGTPAGDTSDPDDLTRVGSNPDTAPTQTLPAPAADPSQTLPAPTQGPVRPAGPFDVPGYEVRGELTRGGMGVILVARQVALDREVAIKTLRPDQRPGPTTSERFLTESRVTAKLQHPAVPPVFDIGRFADGRPYLVMKLIRGRDLQQLLAERASPAAELPRFLAAFEQVCQAVGFAHARGVIHRDLKPANVMLGEFGEVQVMDWGLAREVRSAERGARNEEPGGEDSSSTPHSALRTPHPDLTVAGQVMGTPAYMAPEQARGERVDERADVFALGGILADILTGRPPFVADTGHGTVLMAAAGKVEDAFARLDACGADPELVVLAKRCLRPGREDRPADGKAVADAVAAHRAGVESRLREAEAERAAESAKAEEARHRAAAELQAKRAAEERAAEADRRAKAEAAKAAEQRVRRRAQLLLAAVTSLLLLGALGFAWWRDSEAKSHEAHRKEEEAKAAADEANRQKEEAEHKLALQKAEGARKAAVGRTRAGVASSLKLAEELRALHKFREAGEALDQAEGLAAAGGADDLRGAIRRERATVDFSRELDAIRARKWTWLSAPDGDGGTFDRDSAAAYAKAFAARGLDVNSGDPAALARQIEASPIRTEILRALDDWSIDEPDAATVARVLDVARRAGRVGELAAKLRDPAVRFNPVRLFKLIERADEVAASVPATLVAAALLERRKGDPSVLLAVAQAKHPEDFDITFALALWFHSRDPKRAIGHYRAARALRPEHPAVLTNLGLLLNETGELSAAAAVLREAVRLHPRDHVAHFNLGGVLVKQKHLEKAAEEYREAIRLSPRYAHAYSDLGGVLGRQGKFAEAVKVLAKAVELAPSDAGVRINYGAALQNAGDLDAALPQFKKAVELAPKSAQAHYALGAYYEAKKDRLAAEGEYREAARLDPAHYGDLLKKLPPEK